VPKRSIVSAAEARNWITVSSWLLCGVAWVMTLFCFHFTAQMTVLGVTLLISLAVAAADLRAYRKLRRLEARPLPKILGAPYRSDGRIHSDVRGEPRASRIRLGCLLALDLQSIGLVIFLMLFTIGFAATKLSVLGGRVPGE
jgi:hypothetical protein